MCVPGWAVSKVDGSFAKLAPILYQRFNLIMQLLISHITIPLKVSLFVSSILEPSPPPTPFMKYFLASHFQLLLWAFKNVNCACCSKAMLHQSDDSCFWIWPLLWPCSCSFFLFFFPNNFFSLITAISLFVFLCPLGCVWIVCEWMRSAGNTRQQSRPRWPLSRGHHPGYQWWQHRAHDTHGGSEQDQNLHPAAHSHHHQVWKREVRMKNVTLFNVRSLGWVCRQGQIESNRITKMHGNIANICSQYNYGQLKKRSQNACLPWMSACITTTDCNCLYILFPLQPSDSSNMQIRSI